MKNWYKIGWLNKNKLKIFGSLKKKLNKIVDAISKLSHNVKNEILK